MAGENLIVVGRLRSFQWHLANEDFIAMAKGVRAEWR
jgi:hypothetical protein